MVNVIRREIEVKARGLLRKVLHLLAKVVIFVLNIIISVATHTIRVLELI